MWPSAATTVTMAAMTATTVVKTITSRGERQLGTRTGNFILLLACFVLFGFFGLLCNRISTQLGRNDCKPSGTLKTEVRVYLSVCVARVCVFDMCVCECERENNHVFCTFVVLSLSLLYLSTFMHRVQQRNLNHFVINLEYLKKKSVGSEHHTKRVWCNFLLPICITAICLC